MIAPERIQSATPQSSVHSTRLDEKPSFRGSKPGRPFSSTLRRRNTGIGSEPGVDPRSDNVDEQHRYFSQQCAIQVADFSSEQVALETMSNAEFVKLMQESKPPIEAEGQHPLRWINIGGISWDVISAMALRYDLHSLALEDILHEQGHNQSKADYYQQHLFLRVLCHSLPTDEDRASEPDPTSEYPSSTKRDPRNDVESASSGHGFRRRLSGLSGFRLAAQQQQILRIAALTKDDRVTVKHEPMFIFLLREGTVISIHATPNLEFTQPITERLQRPDSVLRTSEDPSILVESLLDLIVDRILEVMDEYQDKIHQLEHDILIKPGMSTVRRLHILSGDLIMHKRTLEPIKSMLYGLRRYDHDRYAAIAVGRDVPPNKKQLELDRHDKDAGLGVGVGANPSAEGYMSYKAKIYLADVYDHMDFVLTSLDMFAGISENFINYSFNMASYEMNEVMRRLTLATIIFLPLTLLTGYFGMNFKAMWSVNNNSDLLFWIIALPVMGVIVPMFLASDIGRMVRYIKRLMEARRAVIAGEAWR
ncbi:hypothetical protein C8J57DRAFT_1317642 [Mycena rebaudengoi]|nr:hypothetical protein C8J57DRAFT_1317642 [Mycena rebaudengoi]